MDPKDVSQLDPKLREAYERVMGNGPQTQQQPQQPQEQQKQGGETFQPSQAPAAAATPVVAYNAHKNPSKGKGGKILPIIIFVFILVFLAVYTLVWMKVFKLNVPFLP